MRLMRMAEADSGRSQSGGMSWSAEATCRTRANAFSVQGGLTVLFGNLAPDDCVVKSARVSSMAAFMSISAILGRAL
jgi:dihydroxyacid dehydratase/phosphogluconate dehydratase